MKSYINIHKEEELKDVVLMGKHFMELERPPIMKDQMLILAEAEVYKNWKINISEEELKSCGLTKKDLE
jgi:hypothetical protein